MGYGRALLAKDAGEEQAKLQDAMQKKGLFGALGSTVGGLIGSMFLGPGASVLATGLATGAGSAIGRFAGGAMVDIPEGKFYKAERSAADDMFKQDIWASALQSAVTGGLGAKLGGASLTGSANYSASTAGNIHAGMKYKKLFGDSAMFDPSMITKQNLAGGAAGAVAPGAGGQSHIEKRAAYGNNEAAVGGNTLSGTGTSQFMKDTGISQEALLKIIQGGGAGDSLFPKEEQ